MRPHIYYSALLAIALLASPLRANEAAIEQAAEKLVSATVTVRIAVAGERTTRDDGSRETGSSDASKTNASDENIRPGPPDEVTVASGVSLGDGLIVTFHHALPVLTGGLPRIRVTLSGGEQAEAQLRVVDRHSRLVLLEIERRDLPRLELAAQLPKVGGAVLTAAAAGLEPPAVSSGILGAQERSLASIDLPPLLQCDVRTTESSSGAAIVDREGRLIGIVAAVGASGVNSGWTYAVPVRHVERLVKAKADGKAIELKRRRPRVGFTLGAGEAEGSVFIERIETDGPAAAAGIKPGDRLLETDGLRIRSAYQAIDLILKKQPGDRMTFTVERDGRPRTVELLLDGGAMPIAVVPQSLDRRVVRIGPQIRASTAGDGQITIERKHIGEVRPDDARPRTDLSPGDERELLRIQLRGYERVIESMQKELEALRKETTELRKQLREQAK